ncbi:hypothetical protein Ddc_09784 [Ditylenchus destructor]|nr:hypothetical protein Ddc_09784 [Ditylenchus destructor]
MSLSQTCVPQIFEENQVSRGFFIGKKIPGFFGSLKHSKLGTVFDRSEKAYWLEKSRRTFGECTINIEVSEEYIEQDFDQDDDLDMDFGMDFADLDQENISCTTAPENDEERSTLGTENACQTAKSFTLTAATNLTQTMEASKSLGNLPETNQSKKRGRPKKRKILAENKSDSAISEDERSISAQPESSVDEPVTGNCSKTMKVPRIQKYSSEEPRSPSPVRKNPFADFMMLSGDYAQSPAERAKERARRRTMAASSKNGRKRFSQRNNSMDMQTIKGTERTFLVSGESKPTVATVPTQSAHVQNTSIDDCNIDDSETTEIMLVPRSFSSIFVDCSFTKDSNANASATAIVLATPQLVKVCHNVIFSQSTSSMTHSFEKENVEQASVNVTMAEVPSPNKISMSTKQMGRSHSYLDCSLSKDKYKSGSVDATLRAVPRIRKAQLTTKPALFNETHANFSATRDYNQCVSANVTIPQALIFPKCASANVTIPRTPRIPKVHMSTKPLARARSYVDCAFAKDNAEKASIHATVSEVTRTKKAQLTTRPVLFNETHANFSATRGHSQCASANVTIPQDPRIPKVHMSTKPIARARSDVDLTIAKDHNQVASANVTIPQDPRIPKVHMSTKPIARARSDVDLSIAKDHDQCASANVTMPQAPKIHKVHISAQARARSDVDFAVAKDRTSDGKQRPKMKIIPLSRCDPCPFLSIWNDKQKKSALKLVDLPLPRFGIDFLKSRRIQMPTRSQEKIAVKNPSDSSNKQIKRSSAIRALTFATDDKSRTSTQSSMSKEGQPPTPLMPLISKSSSKTSIKDPRLTSLTQKTPNKPPVKEIPPVSPQSVPMNVHTISKGLCLHLF